MASALGGFMAGSIFSKLVLDKSGWNQSIKEVETQDKSKFKKVTGDIGNMVSNIGKVAAVAGTAVVAAFSAMVKTTANAGDEIAKLSTRTGVSTELLSGYKLAADEAGSSLQGLAVGLRTMAGRALDADYGLAEAKRSFDDLGISIKDEGGALKDMNTLLLEVADRFSKMEDGTRKAALAQDIFGRSGMDLIPMLNKGSAGMKEMYGMAERLGIVFSEKAARACEAFNDRMRELRGAFEGVRNDIAIAVMPVFTQFVIFFRDAITELREKVRKFVETGKLREWAIDVGQAFISGMKIATMAVGGLVEAAYFLQGVVFSVGQAITDVLVKRTVGLIMVIDVLSAKIPGLKGVGKSMTEIWQDLIWIGDEYNVKAEESYDKTADLVAVFDTFSKILDDAKAALDKVGSAGESAGNKMHDSLVRTIPSWKGLLDTTKDVAEKTVSGWDLAMGALRTSTKDSTYESALAMVDNFQWGGGEIKTAMKDTVVTTGSYFDGLMNDIAMGFGNTIQKWLEGALTFKDFWLGLWGDIKTAFFRVIGQMIAEWTVKFIGKIISSVADAGSSITKGLSSVVGGIAGAGSAAGGIWTGLGAMAGTLLGGLLGGGKDNKDVTFWLKPMSERLQELVNWTGGTIVPILDDIKSTLWTMTDQLGKIHDVLAESISAQGGYEGTVTRRAQVFIAHAGEQVSIKRQGGGQGISGTNTFNFHINALDGADVERVFKSKILPVMQRYSRAGVPMVYTPGMREA